MSSTPFTGKVVVTAYIEYNLMKVFGNKQDCGDTFLGELFGEHPVLATLRNAAAGYLMCEEGRKMRKEYKKDLIIFQHGVNEKFARDIYIHHISASFFGEEKQSWCRVALTMEMTSQLVEEAVILGHKARVRDLVNWCLIVFKERHVDDWIGKQGGWEQILDDPQVIQWNKYQYEWQPFVSRNTLNTDNLTSDGDNYKPMKPPMKYSSEQSLSNSKQTQAKKPVGAESLNQEQEKLQVKSSGGLGKCEVQQHSVFPSVQTAKAVESVHVGLEHQLSSVSISQNCQTKQSDYRFCQNSQ